MLTQREREVVDLVTLGDSNPMIAYRLQLSESRVKKLVLALMNKLNVDKRLEIAKWRLSRGNE